MSQPSAAGWLSPTRAWRLIECPASVRPVAGNGPAGAGDQEVNTGTLAHRVLERWIRAEGYRAADPRRHSRRQRMPALPSSLVSHLPAGGFRVPAWLPGSSLVDLIGDRSPDQVFRRSS